MSYAYRFFRFVHLLRTPHPIGSSSLELLPHSRFDLDSVGLPSDHWEWVGGWMVDSEMEASADQDGWIYGRAASEISETALGRRNPGTSGDGGDVSPATAANTETAATQAAASPLRTREAGAKSEQEHVQGGSPSGSRPRVAATTAAPSAAGSDQKEPRAADGGRDSRRREPGGVNGGAGGNGQGGPKAAGGGGAREAVAEGLWLRRRRLVRVRMVRRVDGARESTTSILEMMRR